jgi:HAE1 family hydrophobic/amphiphilic exporter-1
MAFRVSTWGIKNPIPVALLFIAAVLAGLIAYQMLPIKQFPNITFPAVVVSITENGAAPGEMETQITRPIEDAMAGISNVKSIRSAVNQGVSTTVVEFQLGEDLQKVTDEVRTKVDQTRAVLPREIDPPRVQRFDFSSLPIITYAVSAPGMSPADISWFIDDTISRALQSQPGVAQIARVGGVDREINVIIDPERMASFGLTASDLNAALSAADVNIPGGRLIIGGREQTVRVVGEVDAVARLSALHIPTSGGRFVRLSDVASVGDGSAEQRGFARLDGRPVVGFQVLKTNDSSEVAVEDKVAAAVAKLEQQYKGVKITKIFSTVDDTRDSYSATLRTMIEGMLLAALVVWLFLRDWRATAITAIAMPVSLIPTFVMMSVFHFSLNVVTLLALTLVIGILVDDAIVEIENIQKRVQAGARPYHAAMEGADQIGLAVVATTMTIVVVFTPVSFMASITGQFFREFGVTVAFAVLFSLLVARLLTPLLAAYFLKPVVAPHPRGDLNPLFRGVLEWALSHRIVTTIIGAMIFLLSLGLTILLPTAVQPPGNANYFFVNIQGPPGATQADMSRIANDTAAVLHKAPETTMVFVQIGSTAGEGFGGGFGGDSSSGVAVVVLKDPRTTTVTQIQDRMRDSLRSIPDARVTIESGGFGSAAVQTLLTSENGAQLDRAAEELQREMRGLKSVADPRPSTPPTGPEIVIRPRPADASRLGVSAETIAALARTATLGDIDANVPKLTDGERRIPVRIRLPLPVRTDIDQIKALRVPTAAGGTTSLSSVADIDFEAGPAEIDRYGRKRDIAIDSDLAGGAQLGQALKDIKNLPIMRHLPPGVEPATLGNQEEYQTMFQQLGLAIVSGISMIFAVLVLLFRSFFKPVTILSALPMAIGGAFLALIIMGMSVSMPSLIGLLMLLGLAAKNSILLVEYAIEREREGMAQREAIIEACRERARPIIMTSVAMAAGMLPTALAIGKGSEFRQPMAVAVIGGLVTSTVLSLILVPVVYEMIDDFEHWLAPRLARFLTPVEASAEERV